MKVSNVSIIQSQNVEQSIISAIREMFNSRAAADFISCLNVYDLVGTCIQEIDNKITEPYISTSYFIATQISENFIRVEYCSKYRSE